MARLNQIIDGEDEFPELSILLRPREDGDIQISDRACTERDRSLQTKQSENMIDVAGKEVVVPWNVAQVSFEEKHSSGPQPMGPLKPANINSRRLPSVKRHVVDETETSTAQTSNRTSPSRSAKRQVDYSKFAPRLSDASLSFSDNDSFTDLSGFIVPDSASDEEVLPFKSRKGKEYCKTTSKSSLQQPKKYASSPIRSPLKEQENTGPIDLTSPNKEMKTSKLVCPESPPRFKTPPRISDQAGQYFDVDEPFSKLRFSPPRSKSPYKRTDGSHPVTPPSSPSKPKLQSPSKSHRIPPSPHRPSIDAFWSADVINDWNEQYSPKKALKSPRKMRLHPVDEDNDELSPSESPRKTLNKTPGKRDKKLVDRRKAFDERKEHLAASFLAEVDLAVADGQVAAMAESTGGIKIIWSKKLSSTAGRANWRREAVRSKTVDGAVSTIIHRHHASIELAEKVIDDEERLTNVIAHEYCHLANFMISRIKDNPHGVSFKSWAAKATRAFETRNINVTTKHTYEIAYKYIWACSSETCGLEYKRHSKSIDPAKHSCGRCKSKLVQIQPAPRKGSANGGGKRSEFQVFVKSEHEKVRAINPGAGFGEIMAILGRDYRESKKPTIVQDNLGKRPRSVVEEVGLSGGGVDDVASKLDLLNVEA